MKFTKSKDGIERVSISLGIYRFSREEIKRLREYLKKHGEPTSDKYLKEYIRLSIELDLPMEHD